MLATGYMYVMMLNTKVISNKDKDRRTVLRGGYRISEVGGGGVRVTVKY